MAVRRLLPVLFVAALACGDAAVTSTTPPPPPPTSAPAAPGSTSEAPTSSASPPAAGAATTPATTAPRPPLRALALEPIAAGLHQPTVVGSAHGELFVAEREGRVVALAGDGTAATLLDLTDRTLSAGIEQGLLGVAFHPSDPRRVFVYRTVAGGDRRLAEFAEGDPESERVLWQRPQPGDEPRHYGGMVAFGPDGLLWVAVGDGAASRHGQDPTTHYGTILRFDVDGLGRGDPEVWAHGLRNPWRFAIDDGLVYVADVGFEAREEVNVVPVAEAGHNFGWSIAEGDACFSVRACDPAGGGLTPPVLTYGHDEGCSVTGGVVYRGSAIPELNGHYFYGDWCGQWVRSFRFAAGQVIDERDWSEDLPEAGQVNAFGAGPDRELYIVNFAGEVWKVVGER